MAGPSHHRQAGATPVSGERFLIVEAAFYPAIGALLLNGAKAALDAVGARYDVISVPGALEIPPAIAIMLDRAEERDAPYAGAIALGCVIRGETFHFEIVAGESARALMDLSVSVGLPLGNGVLTVENEQQAIVRADPAQGDKGGDAARAAIALYLISEGAI